jgi:predicted AlkP superfamily phosphohydrolase/phosphomutase
LFSDLNKQLVFIQPVTDVPQGCPDQKACHDVNSDFSSPGKQRLCEWRKNLFNQIGASDFKKEVDENEIHPNDAEEF